jgi:hypothetical protein
MEQRIGIIFDNAKNNLINNSNIGLRGWTKFTGDIFVRIVSDLLKQQGFNVSEANAYILGYPIEFDLLILKQGAQPEKYTNAYNPADVQTGIEFKTRGMFGGKNVLDNNISHIKNNFLMINAQYPNIKFVYLTFQETCSTKNSGSINYFQSTINGLAPYKAFCLKDTRGGFNLGQWNSFINSL